MEGDVVMIQRPMEWENDLGKFDVFLLFLLPWVDEFNFL